MPRRTAKSKVKNENDAVKALTSKNTKQKNNGKKEKCIKKELDPPKQSIVEEVVHRKSERRRVARDIFLVFEEESKRKSRTNQKQTKPKFGHLKIEDPIRPKGLLRDIKNEPKCYLKSKTNATISQDIPILKTDSKLLEFSKEEKKLKNVKSKTSAKGKTSGCSKKLKNVKSVKVTTLQPETCTIDNNTTLVARVNPIFLWVKQDDTRIVEVRCEDYDKRNRIRITKTANGWRSIPRSDPTTSRVLKFNPTALMKVKRENNVHETSNVYNSKIQNKTTLVCKDFSIAPSLTTGSVDNEIDSTLTQNGVDTVCNPLAIKKAKSKSKKSKKAKKKSNIGKSAKRSELIPTAESKTNVNIDTITTHLNPPLRTNSSDIQDFPAQISAKLESLNAEEMPESHLDTNNLVDSLPVSIFKCNNEILESGIVTSNPSLAITIPPDAKSTYQIVEEELSFHLCPKTGLFVANNIPNTEYVNESYENITENVSKADKNYLNSNKDEFNNIDIGKISLDSKVQISEENTESLEAKTKNLKDLLDDADLLQNCDDNTNSDADLIDNLVKTSCENNLIQANEIITKTNEDQIPDHIQMITDVSDPPKCLSFNEAGEIEDLSEELFQSNTFLESFEKQSAGILSDSQVILHSTSTVEEASIIPHKNSLSESIEPVLGNMDKKSNKAQEVSETDESPKDLSYKKREEVCPQSESRSQCAVTSSSDVIKSPLHRDDTSLTSPSDTLKNLILEQFIKLNALTTQHQRETTVSDKQKHSDIPNMKSVYSKPEQSSNIIETVVIDDDYSDTEIEEPLKKRLRLHKPKVISQNKLAMIDKDPDPLTQLRLLIRNTQWKVPDPILVPKERLSAVLASPAREIPLLITTRPELRLPEAFAYPEIIQNPNILVISMAQLEAILKNELQVEKEPLLKSVKTDSNQQLSEEQDEQLTNRVIDLQLPTPEQHFKHTSKLAKNISTNSNPTLPSNNKQPNAMELSESLPSSRDYAKISQTDSSSSDLNSAAMSVLNQMLWLPYFGHISQEISKYIKNPIASQEKCSNSTSLFNSQANGITNLEEVFRNTDKLTGNSVLNTGLQCFQQQFKTNEELSLFQKIVQHQMQSVLQLNQLPAEPSKLMNSLTPESNSISLVDKSTSKIEHQTNLTEQRKQKHFSSNKQTSTSLCKNQTNNISSHNISLPEKSYNLRSSVAGRHSNESKQYSNNNQRHISDNKPRLTCKSLSNLIDPEHSIIPSSASVSYGQNSTGFLYSESETKRSSAECKVIENNAEQKGQFLANAAIVPQSQKSCGNIAVNHASCNEIQKEKSKSIDQSSLINDVTGLTADSNVPLWHPLFGSNTKTAYSSPWQWTTVTATGE